MSQAPTLYQFDLELNHTDRGISEAVSLRTARHPSETMQRVWLRVLAFTWHWQERLQFGPGLSDPEAPDIVERNFSGETTQWIRVGKAADPAKIQREVDQNPHAAVAIFFESPARMHAFVDDARSSGMKRLGHVALAAIDPQLIEALATSEERRAKATITIAGDHFYIELGGGKTLDGAVERARCE